jgi:hypothetical protein
MVFLSPQTHFTDPGAAEQLEYYLAIIFAAKKDVRLPETMGLFLEIDLGANCRTTGDTLMDKSRNSSKYEYTFTVLQKNPPMYPCLYMLVLSVFLEKLMMNSHMPRTWPWSGQHQAG